MPAPTRDALRAQVVRLRLASVRQAIREQGLSELVERLTAIVPDIRDQYTTFELTDGYYTVSTRAQHAFQMSLVERAIAGLCIPEEQPITIVDIGDSAGTHVRYIQGLHPGRALRCLSVNLDEDAVRKIRAKGLQAVCVRAEDLAKQGIEANLLLAFETIEHLVDPVHFLKDLAEGTNCDAFVVTMPYLAESRVGLAHIRQGRRENVTPENTHIFELSPADWQLLFRHAGWAVKYEQIYLQYPRRGPLRVMKNDWRHFDFEGFWGAILAPDPAWKSFYSGW